jgi:hypothetical protein
MSKLGKYRYGWRVLIVVLVVLVFVGSWAVSQIRSTRDRAEVAKMTEKMRTVCVGRFLVDVPAQADVRFSNTLVDGFQVDTLQENGDTFRARVAAREAVILAGGANAIPSGPVEMVEARSLHIMNMIGRTFVYRRRRNGMSHDDRQADDVSVEVHSHTGGITFTVSADYMNLAGAKAAEALLTRLRLRGKDEVPTNPGFCIERAVFAERSAAPTTGAIAMHLSLPGHSDLAVVLDSMPGGHGEYSLIEHISGRDVATKGDEMIRVTKLRKHMRSIHGMYGEEVLERVRELNFATTYGFVWASEGPHDDPMRPPVSLELQAGIGQGTNSRPVDASLHKDAMLALWDSIVSSIRLRKNDPSPEPSTRPVPLAQAAR